MISAHLFTLEHMREHAFDRFDALRDEIHVIIMLTAHTPTRKKARIDPLCLIVQL